METRCIVHDLGMGTAFAFKRRNWKTFLTERLQRLLVPMFFGMWTVGFVGGIITGSADLDGNSFVDTTVAFILHVFLHRSFSGFHCSGKSLPSAFVVPLEFVLVFITGRTNFPYCAKIFYGKLATALRSTFTMKAGLGIFIFFRHCFQSLSSCSNRGFLDSLVLVMSGFGISYSFCLATSVSYQENNTMNFSIRIEN